MSIKTKGFQTGKIFGKAAKEIGFNGLGATRFIEYTNYWLIINHQKSSYSKYFYINVGLLYKEMLADPLTEDEIKNTFKAKVLVFPHVSFRAECCPGIPDNLFAMIDSCVENEQSDELTNNLKEALIILRSFIEKNYHRQTIRKLYNEKKLSALICKEV